MFGDHNRIAALLPVAGALVLVLTVGLSADARSAEWQTPHTAWGAPDLEGLWSNETLTPFNNFLSGVYYVQTWPGADTINFHDPRPQAGDTEQTHVGCD